MLEIPDSRLKPTTAYDNSKRPALVVFNHIVNKVFANHYAFNLIPSPYNSMGVLGRVISIYQWREESVVFGIDQIKKQDVLLVAGRFLVIRLA